VAQAMIVSAHGLNVRRLSLVAGRHRDQKMLMMPVVRFTCMLELLNG
jgi:hypothetical protein